MRFLLILLSLSFLVFKSSEAAQRYAITPGISNRIKLISSEPIIFNLFVDNNEQLREGYTCKLEFCPLSNESDPNSGRGLWPHYSDQSGDYVLEKYNTNTSSWEVIDDDEGIYNYPMAYIRVGGNYCNDEYRIRRYSGNAWIYLDVIVSPQPW